MGLADLCAEIQMHNKAIVMHQTFGHLRVQPRKKYQMRIVFSCSDYGGSHEIVRTKTDAPDSPWLYQHMQQFCSRKAKPGNIYVFEGTYYSTKTGRGVFQGKTRRIDI